LEYVLGPIVSAFGALTALSVGGMMWVMRLPGIEASLAVAVSMVKETSKPAPQLLRIDGAARGPRARLLKVKETAPFVWLGTS
jgi:hypothetical protein